MGSRSVKARMKVGVDDGVAERFEGAAGGDDLGEHVGAVFVVADHGLDGLELAADLAEPGSEGGLFGGCVNVFHRRGFIARRRQLGQQRGY